ncbi:hypothetical protein EYF80_038958 [Liparis tanakae]|uniref:Uncharacterized protein n=1 Tax=Liparis tanakae TaxID=230148 RepID=A0A4Z2GC44_9TELE|nr:hypothetical protein EYF80_038958 [Liparis tanakae]
MFIQNGVPISAVKRLLLRSAFPDENHMFYEALHLRHADHGPPLPPSILTQESRGERGMAAQSSSFPRQAALTEHSSSRFTVHYLILNMLIEKNNLNRDYT